MRNLAMFLPDELLPLLLVAAGLCLIVGLRSTAFALAALAIATPFVGVIVGTLLDQLPWFVAAAILAFSVLSMARALSNLLIGRRSTDHMVGDLAADVVRFALKLPFRVLGWVGRLLWRLLAMARRPR